VLSKVELEIIDESKYYILKTESPEEEEASVLECKMATAKIIQ